MYNPQKFRETNISEAFELMDRYPFATVISAVGGESVISHLPLTPKINGDQIELIGHLARANPHWKQMANANITAVFLGAHTYITPKWYVENNVPTWNYSSVHASGIVNLIEDEIGIIDCLKELTTHVERHWPSGWEFFIPKDLLGPNLTKNIVGFKIKVTNFNFKKKLSQNRNDEDRRGVIEGLSKRLDEQSKNVLNDMKKLYRENGTRLA
jgi:transcriptional regulator